MTILDDLKSIADREIAEHSQTFFKTAKGEYGEGDRFLGVRVPKVRLIAKKYSHLSLEQLDAIISSEFHEVRLCALVILVERYQKTSNLKERDEIYRYYIKRFKYINSWDLVDTSCHKIVGAHLEDRNRDVLYKWARSRDLWTRRISIVSTFWFIHLNDLDDSYRLAEALIPDEHDLIHKAVGWVLRECGKKDFRRLEKFINKHVHQMPRTMLRYAIEKFPERKRKAVLAL